jgi:hypothetical protein
MGGGGLNAADPEPSGGVIRAGKHRSAGCDLARIEPLGSRTTSTSGSYGRLFARDPEDEREDVEALPEGAVRLN